MADVANRYQDQLPRIKKLVKQAYDYFRDNYDRYNEFKKFVFQTSLNENDISVLGALNKPTIEFNILEAYISRLRGEFAQQQPSIIVSSQDGESASPQMIEVIEGHLRHILQDANNNTMEYDCYTDLLAGGFSVLKVYTDYINAMSMKQSIYWKRLFDPTLAGFDPTAQLKDKSDGRFCFELFPKSESDFKEMYPDVDLTDLKFSSSSEGFNWSYQNTDENIVLICDFYEKKKKKVKLVELSDGQTMTMDKYKDYIKNFEILGGLISPPQIRDQRYTEIVTICRYRVIENKVLEYVETDYKSFPLVFVDGNSMMIRNGLNGAMFQMTRPYVYNARGAQKLKNFAGQTLANELENMIMHKWKVAKESIPAQYKDAYINPQIASVLVYNAFKNDDPNVPLPPPQEINRIPTPPEVTNTFSITDTVTQNILGSFDIASRQMTSGELSGVAVIESATLSNAASMPYVVGFLSGLGSACRLTVELIPYYYVTPRTIPVVGLDGKKSFVKINQDNQISMDYDSNVLDVKVEPGVNFSVQKSRALQQIIALMQASPLFAQFMNEDGLGILLDNIEIRGADQLKVLAEQWQQKMKMMQQQAANQPNPLQMKQQLEMAKLQQKNQSDMMNAQLKAAQLNIDKIKLIAGLSESRNNNLVQLKKAQVEHMGQQVDLAIKVADIKHRHMMDRHKVMKGVGNG